MDEPLAALIFSGALERHPGLQIVLAETGIAWLPYTLERMDDTYRNSSTRLSSGQPRWPPVTMPPSAYFRRQVWARSRPISSGCACGHAGEDRVMWASDYPHPDSTWPASQQAIEENFKGVPAATRRRILCDNANELNGLSRKVRPARVRTGPGSMRLAPDSASTSGRDSARPGDTASPRQGSAKATTESPFLVPACRGRRRR